MNYDRIRRYEKLATERGYLLMKLEALETGAEVVTDTVSGSAQVYPYTKHTIKISGMTPEEAERVAKEKAKLTAALRRVSGEMARIERTIDHIGDPVVQALLEQHILKGLSWRDSSSKVFGFGRVPEDTARMMVRRYFRSHC